MTSLGEPVKVDEDRADAVEVLNDALEWELTPARWQRVETAVEELSRAAAIGGGEGLRRAVADLELAGPVRASSARNTSDVPEKVRVPAHVREQINVLIPDLRAADPADQPGNDAPSP